MLTKQQKLDSNSDLWNVGEIERAQPKKKEEKKKEREGKERSNAPAETPFPDIPRTPF